MHVLPGKAPLAESRPSAAEFELGEAIRPGVNRAEVAVALAMDAQGKQTEMLDDPRLQRRACRQASRRNCCWSARWPRPIWAEARPPSPP
ncbi:hypothetical protein [Roseateles saccharophilus]|uniref:hypothetical protein n=1 Tax=Roseateles saccharophilus TaxID=304 RepID=UPI001052D735|nr:hypothetical protein [Roseateles saccharophilus]MDG0832592.1 hypothetical protein [Roseateles saccharophilus]